MWKKIVDWFDKWLHDEYVLTVWYPGGTEFEPKATKRTYKMKSISKKTSTHVIGVQTNGNALEIKTNNPFDYQIEKVK